jgi:hypothetical protein
MKDENRIGMKGYYQRPSRAIEKGGGFFIPGFEDDKLPIFTSSLLLLLFVANRIGIQLAYNQQIISELTGIFVSLLLFYQGIRSKVSMVADKSVSNIPEYLSIMQMMSKNESFVTDQQFKLIKSISVSISNAIDGITSVLIYDENQFERNQILLEYGPITMKPSSSLSNHSTTQFRQYLFETIGDERQYRVIDYAHDNQIILATKEDYDRYLMSSNRNDTISLPSNTKSIIFYNSKSNINWMITSKNMMNNVSLADLNLINIMISAFCL